MNKIKYVFYLALFLTMIGCLVSCDSEECQITDLSPTEGRVYHCSGYSCILSIPESCEEGGCGLIVDVHGLFNSPSKQDSNTNLRELGQNAVSRGALTPYIVIQPKAPNGLTGWSITDAPYVQDFIENVAETWMVDKKRIHFTGFSQGGGMTMWAICNKSDYYASFAPVSSGNDFLCFEDMENLPEAPILHIVGESDPWVWNGAMEYKNNILYAMSPYTEQLIGRGTGYSRTRYTGNGMQYDWVPHCGDHCIAGGDIKADGCECDTDLNHGETVIDFFINHPKE